MSELLNGLLRRINVKEASSDSGLKLKMLTLEFCEIVEYVSEKLPLFRETVLHQECKETILQFEEWEAEYLSNTAKYLFHDYNSKSLFERSNYLYQLVTRLKQEVQDYPNFFTKVEELRTYTFFLTNNRAKKLKKLSIITSVELKKIKLELETLCDNTLFSCDESWYKTSVDVIQESIQPLLKQLKVHSKVSRILKNGNKIGQLINFLPSISLAWLSLQSELGMEEDKLSSSYVSMHEEITRINQFIARQVLPIRELEKICYSLYRFMELYETVTLESDAKKLLETLY
jgi:hypothetical protein